MPIVAIIALIVWFIIGICEENKSSKNKGARIWADHQARINRAKSDIPESGLSKSMIRPYYQDGKWDGETWGYRKQDGGYHNIKICGKNINEAMTDHDRRKSYDDRLS